MVIGSIKIKLQAFWAHSLKEKRMIVQSLVQKIKHKFNVSIAEVEDMDVHQSIVLGICCVSNSQNHANSMLDHVLNFIDSNTEAEVIQVEMDFY